MKYHFQPKQGWMNDPNGLVEFKGHYHAFFQHNPHDIKWGPMHWGHAVSKDFLNWEELAIALYPDEEYENDGGCFSGSAIVKDDRLYLFYTSVSKEFGQAQSVAYSDDGIHFTKYEGNPVIPHYPEKSATYDFRDPKVFAYEDEYRMVIGTKFDGHGRIVIYKSADLLKWEYVGILYDEPTYLNAIECPDLFMVDGKWILLFSRIGFDNCQAAFIEGEFDGSRFIPGKEYPVEFGPKFYAPQTFETISGRRILIGWFFDWKTEVKPGSTSAGALTIPREISFDKDGLHIFPVKEARHLLKHVPMPSDWQEVLGIEGEKGTVYALEDAEGIEVFSENGTENYSFYINEC